MFLEIKNKIDKELINYAKSLDKNYNLKEISPLLFNTITDFILRDGKRIRPILFIIGYLGFAKKTSPGLYKSALSIELLHDFLLVHDDIIDKSAMRRGKPAMHTGFNNSLKKYKNLKFNGQDLAIVAADVIYALSLDVFLTIKAPWQLKERALQKLIHAALYTGTGEFIELIYNLKNIDNLTLNDIYKIYDLKTANYTFCSPLTTGAILAAAKESEIKKIANFGLFLGRAFQIKDDIIGLFGKEKEIGKSNLTDLQEGKKTVLIWYAYNLAETKNKKIIKQILNKKIITQKDLSTIRLIISQTKALDTAKDEIRKLLNQALTAINSSNINKKYKLILAQYSEKILQLQS